MGTLQHWELFILLRRCYRRAGGGEKSHVVVWVTPPSFLLPSQRDPGPGSEDERRHLAPEGGFISLPYIQMDRASDHRPVSPQLSHCRASVSMTTKQKQRLLDSWLRRQCLCALSVSFHQKMTQICDLHMSPPRPPNLSVRAEDLVVSGRTGKGSVSPSLRPPNASSCRDIYRVEPARPWRSLSSCSLSLVAPAPSHLFRASSVAGLLVSHVVSF